MTPVHMGTKNSNDLGEHLPHNFALHGGICFLHVNVTMDIFKARSYVSSIHIFFFTDETGY